VCRRLACAVVSVVAYWCRYPELGASPSCCKKWCRRGEVSFYVLTSRHGVPQTPAVVVFRISYCYWTQVIYKITSNYSEVSNFHLLLNKKLHLFPRHNSPRGPRRPHWTGFTVTLRPHSVGLLWTSDQPIAETSTWQHTTRTIDRHQCPRWGSNPQSQQASGCRTQAVDRAANGIGKLTSYSSGIPQVQALVSRTCIHNYRPTAKEKADILF
jgi:hypothetical protein